MSLRESRTRTRRLLVRLIVVVCAAAISSACSLVEPDAARVPVRASVVSWVGSAQGVVVAVRLSNDGNSRVYIPDCYVVQRREAGKWVDDPHLGGACSAVPGEAIDASAEIVRDVVLPRTSLPEEGSITLRVLFTVSDSPEHPLPPYRRAATSSITIG